jgi:WD40 repeat protein
VRGLYERALSSGLVAQSRWLQVTRLGRYYWPWRWGIESMRRSPSYEAEEVLRRCIALQPKRVARFDHDYRASVIAFSPKGSVVATASGSLSERKSYEAEARGKTLEDFVDMADLQRFLKRQDELVGDVAGNVAYLWDPLTGTQLARLEHSGSVMTVAFSADGSRLATGATDGTAKVWEIPSGRMISCVNLARSLWP